MAFDETLAARVRRALASQRGVAERRMFGGLCFLIRGNMCCGVVGDRLMVRVGPDAYEEALSRPHASEMDFTGRPLRGMVYVTMEGLRSEAALMGWVRRGSTFAGALPARKPKKR
jgi:TfoX/Sxy family transcriptional regulator of competence genes